MLLVSPYLNFVRRSGQSFAHLAHGHMQVTPNERLLHRGKFTAIDSMVVSQSKCKQFLQINIHRCYGEAKGKKLSQKIQFLRSRLNTLFVFGNMRISDWYGISLIVSFGALGIYFFSIDLRGGFTENLDKVETPVKMKDIKN